TSHKPGDAVPIQEPPRARVIISRPQVIQLRSWIERLAGELEFVLGPDLASASKCLAPGIVYVLCFQLACRVCQSDDAAEPVVVVEEIESRARFGDEAEAVRVGDVAVWPRLLKHNGKCSRDVVEVRVSARANRLADSGSVPIICKGSVC